MERWKPAMELMLAVVCMVWLWVMLLLATAGMAGLLVDMLTHFDRAWN